MVFHVAIARKGSQLANQYNENSMECSGADLKTLTIWKDRYIKQYPIILTEPTDTL